MCRVQFLAMSCKISAGNWYTNLYPIFCYLIYPVEPRLDNDITNLFVEETYVLPVQEEFSCCEWSVTNLLHYKTPSQGKCTDYPTEYKEYK